MCLIQDKMTLQESLQQEFSLYKNQAEQGSFLTLREQAFSEFEKLGFPTTKHEEWKYTSLKSITEKTFTSTCEISSQIKTMVDGLAVSSIKANRLVFVNGSLVAELSSVIEADGTIVIGSLSKERHAHKAVFEQHFGKYADIKGQALNALNTALLSDGAFVYVPAGKKVEFPIVVIHIADATTMNVLAQPRNLIVAEANSDVFVIEQHNSMGTNASFTNVVTEVYAGENAHVEHYKIQQQTGETYHNNYTQIFQEANTSINQVTLTLDGSWVRNNLHFYMNGVNCNSLLYGLYIPDGNQHVDNHTRVDHANPNCFSDEKYKGVLKDHSTAVFNGKIHVHLDAQKTNAYQRNQNVLLSNDATINTKPQLEIFADDVKCTHGATIGQLDEEQMFYLRSRGIPEDAARKILLNAFADDIAEKIKIPELVQLLEEEIERKI